MTYPTSIETAEDIEAIARNEPAQAARMIDDMSAEIVRLREALEHIAEHDADELCDRRCVLHLIDHAQSALEECGS